MQIEGFAEPADKTADLKPLQITTQGGLTNDRLSYLRKLHHIDGRDLSLWCTQRASGLHSLPAATIVCQKSAARGRTKESEG